MSTGVPKIIVVEKKLRTSPSSRILKGIATLSADSGAGARRDRIGLQLVIEFYQFGIGGGLALPVQPLQQMAAPFGEIDGARRQRLGVKGEPQDVEGLAEQPLPECPPAAASPCGWPTTRFQCRS